jgi:hypothetical protein
VQQPSCNPHLASPPSSSHRTCAAVKSESESKAPGNVHGKHRIRETGHGSTTFPDVSEPGLHEPSSGICRENGCRENGHHPNEDLAKSVYKPDLKYKSLNQHYVFLATH